MTSMLEAPDPMLRSAPEFRLDRVILTGYYWIMEKEIRRVLRKLRGVPGLSEDERHLFARSLAATPDERWRMHENFLRSHDLFTRSSRRKYGFKSPE
jgi:hypothetical protein